MEPMEPMEPMEAMEAMEPMKAMEAIDGGHGGHGWRHPLSCTLSSLVWFPLSFLLCPLCLVLVLVPGAHTFAPLSLPLSLSCSGTHPWVDP